ncbi:transcription/translation regulatory transformer protein RfaH [Photobacterium sp. GJ3]|uniref:transcription/translation regulatory transformer protein RfaH n=1 Tax=Photobacterium sp. GJ3 TaxID=2829502 RepID=UPI001B8AB6D5|nr:transcription/translation regulatory transformer protein RfaH [Photobacterium sp. GJ3]QUJ68236.1 transcription/translation regulatory transformer protein RfaH [Photobacterium sp. GJ3]
MKDWFLLYCKRSEQERAVVNLERQSVTCYYPQVTVEKLVRGKRVTANEPLFPNYMFVRFDPEQVSYTTVRSTRGVADFIRQGPYPQKVQPELLHQLMMNENSEAHREKLSNLPKPGESMELQRGQFQGLEAIYQEPDGEKRSFMLIHLLGKPVKVSVDNADIVRR